MKYNKYTIKTTTEAEDIVAAELSELGVMGVEIEDKVPLTERDRAAMFVDILPETQEDDGIAYVSFYLDAREDNELLLENIRNALYAVREYCDAGELSLRVTELQDEDYLNNWKQYFHKFYIDDILFIPSWEEAEPEDAGKMIIRTDPGSAFGTGKHETTRLCIQALKKYVKSGDSVLDVGTGSGILSVMSFKFGASSVTATDLDIAAVEACRDNLSVNGLKDSDFRLYIGNIIDDPELQAKVGFEAYDIVCANILAPVLIELTPQITGHIKKGGIYIMSGIIGAEGDGTSLSGRESSERADECWEDKVISVVRRSGFEILETVHLGEWTEITARKER